MPWKETEPMTERERFVLLLPRGHPRSHPSLTQGKPTVHHLRATALHVMLAQTGRFTITDLCTDFGISRKTGHKYLRRYQADGAQKGGTVQRNSFWLVTTDRFYQR